jgi:hypothetical protein
MAAVDPTDGKALIAALELLNKQAEEKENERYRASLQRVVDAIGRKLGCGEGDIGAVERAPSIAGDSHGLHGYYFVARWRLPSGHVLGYGRPSDSQREFGRYSNSPSDKFALMPPGTDLNGRVYFDTDCLIDAKNTGDQIPQEELQRAYRLQQLIPPQHLNALLVIQEEQCIRGSTFETANVAADADKAVEAIWPYKPRYTAPVKAKVQEVYYIETE